MVISCIPVSPKGLRYERIGRMFHTQAAASVGSRKVSQPQPKQNLRDDGLWRAALREARQVPPRSLGRCAETRRRKHRIAQLGCEGLMDGYFLVCSEISTERLDS